MSDDDRDDVSGGANAVKRPATSARRGASASRNRSGKRSDARPWPRRAGHLQLVRERILAFARASESVGPAPVAPSPAPPIERVLRYTWFLATERRDAMVREGRGDELEKLFAEARSFQDSLRRDAAD